MKNTLYKQAYKCICSLITRHYIWSNELKKAKHKCTCGNKLTVQHLHTETKAESPAIRTPTKNR